MSKGKGGLVNTPPVEIPPGYVWSKTAANGMGALAKVPPRPGSIPAGKIWNRLAFGGVGGLVNKPLHPDEIPEGKVWNNQAFDGLGGLVNVRPPAYEIPPGMVSNDFLYAKKKLISVFRCGASLLMAVVVAWLKSRLR